jgi:hypothetical protein
MQKERTKSAENTKATVKMLKKRSNFKEDTKFFESETKSTNIGTGPLGND